MRVTRILRSYRGITDGPYSRYVSSELEKVVSKESTNLSRQCPDWEVMATDLVTYDGVRVGRK